MSVQYEWQFIAKIQQTEMTERKNNLKMRSVNKSTCDSSLNMQASIFQIFPKTNLFLASVFAIFMMPKSRSPPIEISNDDADDGAAQSASPSQAVGT